MKELTITEAENGYTVIYNSRDKIGLSTRVFITYKELTEWLEEYLS